MNSCQLFSDLGSLNTWFNYTSPKYSPTFFWFFTIGCVLWLISYVDVIKKIRQEKFVEVPFLPDILYQRKNTTKRRKRVHKIVHKVYPTWRNQTGKSIHFKVAKHFKELFDQADADEITLQDPFSGYTSVSDIQSSQTGRMAFKTVAGFIYYHCRDNLGYPLVN